MKSAVSRGVVAVSAVAVLGLTAACSGSGGGSDGKGEGDGGGKPSKSAQAAPPSATAQLEKAALASGDVKKFKVAKESSESAEAAKSGDKTTPPAGRVDPAQCRPLSEMLTSAAPPKSKAHVSRTLTSIDAADATTTEVVLLAYGQADSDADAEKAMDALRTATKSKKCATFQEGGHRYIGVRPQPAPVGGDEAVSYKLASRKGAFLARDRVSVVRSGSTLIAFRASNVFDPESPRTSASDPKVAEAIVDAQLAKLAGAK